MARTPRTATRRHAKRRQADSISARYPAIKEAAISLGCYNGAIHRWFSVDQYVELLDEALGAEGVYEEDLRVIEAWLGKLTADQCMTFLDGEESEMADVAASCKANAIGLFDDIYRHCVERET